MLSARHALLVRERGEASFKMLFGCLLLAGAFLADPALFGGFVHWLVRFLQHALQSAFGPHPFGPPTTTTTHAAGAAHAAGQPSHHPAAAEARVHSQ